MAVRKRASPHPALPKGEGAQKDLQSGNAPSRPTDFIRRVLASRSDYKTHATFPAYNGLRLGQLQGAGFAKGRFAKSFQAMAESMR